MITSRFLIYVKIIFVRKADNSSLDQEQNISQSEYTSVQKSEYCTINISLLMQCQYWLLNVVR